MVGVTRMLEIVVLYSNHLLRYRPNLKWNQYDPKQSLKQLHLYLLLRIVFIDFSLFSTEFLSFEIDSQNPRTHVKFSYLGDILELQYCPQMGLRVHSSSLRTPVQSIDFFVFSTEFFRFEINSQNPRTFV